jgi:hypothetical protein
MKQRTKSQNGKRSRTKGQAFERWVVSELQRIGLPAERNIAQVRTAAREGCDVEGSDWWIECGCGADPDPRAKYSQAFNDQLRSPAPHHRAIVVVTKRDRCEALATMSITTAAEAYASSREGRALGWRPEERPLITMRFADWLDLVKPCTP